MAPKIGSFGTFAVSIRNISITENQSLNMVIGDGLVARSFKHYETLDEFLIFASGVSHSKSCTEVDFQREEDLLRTMLQKLSSPENGKDRDRKDRTFVYFSTYGMDDPGLRETPYVKHKLHMEELIRAGASRYHIFRLSNLAGRSDNPGTILNFFYSCITKGIPFELWTHSERNIIDVEDVFRIADHILKNNLFLNQVINIANERNYPVRTIVRCIEDFTGQKAQFVERERGGSFHIELSAVLPLYKKLKIEFGEDYLRMVIEKYYPKT